MHGLKLPSGLGVEMPSCQKFMPLLKDIPNFTLYCFQDHNIESIERFSE